MSHSQARSPVSDMHGTRFVYDDDMDDFKEVTPTPESDKASHDSHALSGHCNYPTSDFESESEEETSATHAGVDGTATTAEIAPSGELVTVPTGLDRTGPRVRFRSRVRISAGMGRRRRLSDASTLSGSPSSSISAPLRTHPTGKNGWGPLGSRIHQLASQTTLAQPSSDDESSYANGGKLNENPRRHRSRSSLSFLSDSVDEHTHLMTSPTMTRSYVSNRYAYHLYHDERERERRWKEQMMDEAFGRWPGRLLNRHWWWWNLEPILCSCCYEPDEEYL